MGIKAPVHVSMKLGDSSNVYNKIVNAAENPHLSIPETEISRRKKQHHQFHRSLIFALGAFTLSTLDRLTHTLQTSIISILSITPFK